MPDSPPLALLRPALELAWAVAKIGSQARPAVAPPGRLRPLMRFAKLPDRALSAVRQVVEEDEAFRTRVADIADEAVLGRAPWLWLTHPDGWEEDLGALVRAAHAEVSEVQGERAERRAGKRLEAAEATAARAEAELAGLRQVNADLTAEVSAHRQARRQADASRRELSVALTEVQADRARIEEVVAALEARVTALAQETEEATAALAATRTQLQTARTEIQRLQAELHDAAAETSRLMAERAQRRVAVTTAAARASAAARHLSEAVVDVDRAARGDELDPPPGPAAGPSEAPAPPPWTGSTDPSRSVPSSPARVGRRPVSLPPAIFDDSLEAADHLMRVAGILLVVDGYNVTISSWPHLELSRQRHQLVDALAELAMRAGPSVHVVFDGTDGGGRFGPPAAARGKMRVTFSPEDVEADEVIVDLVEARDMAKPVVVATDDRRVRDTVRDRGANVISVAQLLAVLRRAPA